MIEDVPTITSVTLVHDESAGIQNDLGKDDVSTVLPQALQALLADKNPAGLEGALEAGEVIGVARNSFGYDLKTDGSNDESGDPHSDSADQSVGSTGANDGLENLSFEITNGQDSGLRTVEGQSILLYRDEENDNIVYGVVAGEGEGAANSLAFVAVLQEDGTGLSDGAHTGTATWIQYQPLRHPDGGSSHDEQVSQNQPDLSLPIRITDDEGDSSVARLNIDVHDDGPSLSTSGVPVDTLVVDETLLGTDATANFADNFTVDAGVDGLGSVTYALSVTDGTVSGVVDTATGQAVSLHEAAGVIEGRNADGDVVFTLSVDVNGTVELDQLRAVRHPNTSSNDEPISLSANVVTLTATVRDGDGDTANDSTQLGSNITFRDDGPSANNDVATLNEGSLQPQNIAIVMDFSSSVSDRERAAEIESVRTFARNLFNRGASVSLSVVAFDNDAGTLGRFSSFGDLDTALNRIDSDGNFETVGGDRFSAVRGTNFNAAIDELLTGYSAQPGANNQVLFLSDGNTIGASQLNRTAAETLNTNEITITPVAIGDAVRAERFESFFDDADVPVAPPLTADDFEDLAAVLIGTIEASRQGNLLDNDTFGADGRNDPAITGLRVEAMPGETTGTPLTEVSTVDGVETYKISTSHYTLTVQENGDYDFTLTGDIDQDTDFVFAYTIVDGDGDPATATLTITVHANSRVVLERLIVDESDLDTNATGNFSDHFSIADDEGVTAVAYALSLPGGEGTVSGLRDSETGQAVRLYRTESGTIEGRVDNIVVFTLSVAANGDVTLDQLRAVRHPDRGNHDDAITLDADVISLSATVDYENGSNDSETIDPGRSLVFEDDGPSAQSDTRTLGEGEAVDGNVLGNDDAGNDEGLSVSGIRRSGAQNDTELSEGPLVINGEHGQLTINPDGSYHYEADSDLSADQQDVFVYTITDIDGDESEANLTFAIENEGDCILLDPEVNPRQRIDNFDREDGDCLNLHDVLDELREGSAGDPRYLNISEDPDISLEASGRLLADGIQIATLQVDTNTGDTTINFNQGLGHSIIEGVTDLIATDFSVEEI